MRGGRAAGGRWESLAWKSCWATGKDMVFNFEQEYTLLWNGADLNFEVQSNLTDGATATSPSSTAGPMPPAVPVVMTNFGLASAINCAQSLATGSLGPSWLMCS